MKGRYIIYNVVCILLCFVCFSCTDESESMLTPTETGLVLRINAGQHTFARAEDGGTTSSEETAWDNTIQYLDVFIFDSETGELVDGCYFHFGDGKDEYGIINNIISPVCLIPGNWKPRFEGHESCDVYVVANLHLFSEADDNIEAGKTELSKITDLQGLKQLVDEYEEIALPMVDSKIPFTMSGSCTGWKPAESSDVYTIPVELIRLAAKIEISLDLDFKDKTTDIEGVTYNYPTNVDIAQLHYSFHNYATNALVLPGSDDMFERTIVSGNETTVKFLDSENSTSVPKIIVYTYPTEWTGDILKETYIIINARLESTQPQSNGEYLYMNNYYKVPIRLATDECKYLERNYWYKIKAVISEIGNATPDNPVELRNVKYEVAPWNDMYINIDNDNPQYLELSEYDVVMRNVAEYDLTFASSSNIKSAVISDVYFINKDGEKVSVNDGEIYALPEQGLNGTLTIHSPVPDNKTIRYMTLTVENGQGMTKEVTIKQYPLEYITGISGLYSYLDDYTGKWPNNIDEVSVQPEDYNGTFKADISNAIIEGLNGHIGNNKDMKSKFYVENEDGVGCIIRIDDSYSDHFRPNEIAASNNRMYHVVITSTSEDYTLARPIMAGDIVDPDNLDNDKLVSPSFMLASQLGNSSTIYWEEAKEQCKNYVEVGMDGTVYDDWRLPTAAEINIIIKYQTDPIVNTGDNDAVMDYVLNYGSQNTPDYWTSRRNYSMEIPESGEGTLHSGKEDGKSNRRVRCVRDYRISDE